MGCGASSAAISANVPSATAASGDKRRTIQESETLLAINSNEDNNNNNNNNNVAAHNNAESVVLGEIRQPPNGVKEEDKEPEESLEAKVFRMGRMKKGPEVIRMGRRRRTVAPERLVKCGQILERHSSLPHCLSIYLDGALLGGTPIPEDGPWLPRAGPWPPHAKVDKPEGSENGADACNDKEGPQKDGEVIKNQPNDNTEDSASAQVVPNVPVPQVTIDSVDSVATNRPNPLAGFLHVSQPDRRSDLKQEEMAMRLFASKNSK